MSGEQTPLLEEQGGNNYDGNDEDKDDTFTAVENFNHVKKLKASGASTRRLLFEDSIRGSFRRLEELSPSTRDNIGVAASLVRDAILDTQDANDEDHDVHGLVSRAPMLSSWSRKILGRRMFMGLVHTALIVLVLLSFFGPPTWCDSSSRFILLAGGRTHTDKEEGGLAYANHRTCEYLLNSQGPPAFVTDADADAMDEDEDGNVSVSYYPNSHSMYLSNFESHSIETLCVIILLMYEVFKFARGGFFFRHYFHSYVLSAIRCTSLLLLFCAVLIEQVIVYSYPFEEQEGKIYFLYRTMRQLSQYLRLALFVAYTGKVQREIMTVIRLVPIIFRIFVLFFTVLLFYSWVGVVLFYDSPEGKQHFSNLIEAMWTLWICVTTANYPDVMMLAYNENRLINLYFISFMIVEFFIAMNIILAVVVNFYTDEKERFEEVKKKRMNKKLRQAFVILDKHDSGLVDRTSVMELFPLLNEDCPEIKFVKADTAELLFAILDKDGSNALSLDEFLEFGQVMLLEFESADNYMSFFERCFPRAYHSQRFQRLSRTVKSDAFELFVDGILVLNAIVVAIQSTPELRGLSANDDPHIADGYIDTPWEIAETVFTAVYFVEMTLKIIVYGWRSYIEDKRNLFDFTITWLTLAATAYVYYPNSFSDSRLIRFVVMARVLRLFRIVGTLKQFRLLGRTIISILPSIERIFLLLFCLMYLFAIVGVNLYGGKVSRDPQNPLSFALEGTDFADNDYWANNFNDMLSGMNVLFNLLVINNWPEQSSGFVAISNLWTRYFFILFHIVGVVIVCNLVVATLIDSFIYEYQNREDGDDNDNYNDDGLASSRDSVEAEFTDNAGAIFDASEVTGTRTHLTGQYIAKMKKTSTITTQQQRQMMQTMFTRNSSSELLESNRSWKDAK